MIKIIENFLIKYKIYNKTVVIGFSGGPDSCTLALLINELKQKFNLDIVLAYFNHGWRKEAFFEEEFTKDFANKIGAKYCIERAEFEYKKTEENSRDLRYAFFERCASKFNSDCVFLAHNKNDNIETLIYRIIKGTSIKGLTSIPENRGIFYRPLLDVEKEDILNYIRQKEQKCMIDNSNEDVKYKRNLIRKEILPLFSKINPKYVSSINNLILNSIQSYKIIDKYIKEIEKEIFIDNKIKYEKYIELDKEIRLEILNNFIGNYLKYRNRKNLLMYDEFILNNKHSKTSLNSTYFLRTRWKMIFIEKR